MTLKNIEQIEKDIIDTPARRHLIKELGLEEVNKLEKVLKEQGEALNLGRTLTGAWAGGYWLAYSLDSSPPRLSFEIPSLPLPAIWPWKYLGNDIRFDVLKAQLDISWIWIQWDTTKEIRQIITLKRYQGYSEP